MSAKDWTIVADEGGPPVTHCWAEDTWYNAEWDMECSSATCLLEDGHEGPHHFTPDDEIFIRIVP